MIGLLAEKKSQADEYARALGGMSGTFQGTPYRIVHAAGHLYELRPPEEQVDPSLAAKYKSWSIANLPWDEADFAWKMQAGKDQNGKSNKTLLDSIKKGLMDCDEIVIGTDVDKGTNEGTLLAWEILSELHLVRGKKITRMYPVDQSPKEVQKAWANRMPLPQSEVNCGLLRSRWDMLSMQFTRIATACGNGRAVLRQGRLKSSMVKIVGDQFDAISKYKKIPSYTNKFKDDHGVIYTNPEEPVFPKREQVQTVYKHSFVVKDSAVMKQTPPPKFLTLATLAGRLSSKGFSAKQVQSVYQKMYECTSPLRPGRSGLTGVVSYPRTDDATITPEQFKEMLGIADMIAEVVGVDQKLLTHRQARNTHVKPEGAHGANRPGTNVPQSLEQVEQMFGTCGCAIYEMLARNFLACLAEDYQYEAQKGHIKDYPKFVGTSSVPKSAGWKAVFSDKDENLEEAEENARGLGSEADPFVCEMFPPKPQAPTMSWLMKQLEKYKVGTGATRTRTYGEITSNTAKYPLMTDKRGKIAFTEYGEMSYHLLPDTLIGDIGTTEKLFEQMKAVEAGTLDMNVVLHEIQDMVRHDLSVMQANGETMRKKLGVTLQSGSSSGSSSFPQKEKVSGIWKGKQISFNRTWGGHRFTDAEVADLLAGKEISVQSVSKAGKPYAAKGKLANQTYNGASFVGFKPDFG